MFVFGVLVMLSVRVSVVILHVDGTYVRCYYVRWLVVWCCVGVDGVGLNMCGVSGCTVVGTTMTTIDVVKVSE